MERITSAVCEETKDRIKKMADSLGLKQSEVIRLLLIEALNDEVIIRRVADSVEIEAVDVHFDLEGINCEK